MSAITKFLPRNHLSYLVGKIVHWRGPTWWARLTIEIFARVYNINVGEAELPLDKYPSLGDFFVRKLKSGRRPVAESAWVVHPADSQISEHGEIHQGRLIQAKGRYYHLKEFLFQENAAEIYDQGYFVTYYLCPTDYHRVHSPVDGFIRKVTHVPGELWPVNKWSVENVQDLFSVNERIILDIATEFGPVSLVFVGATNVGQIILSFDKNFIGNQLPPMGENKSVEYQDPIEIQKGQELGMFRMGSTVVMVYSEGFRTLYPGKLKLNRYVRYGQALVWAPPPT